MVWTAHGCVLFHCSPSACLATSLFLTTLLHEPRAEHRELSSYQVQLFKHESSWREPEDQLHKVYTSASPSINIKARLAQPSSKITGHSVRSRSAIPGTLLYAKISIHHGHAERRTPRVMGPNLGTEYDDAHIVVKLTISTSDGPGADPFRCSRLPDGGHNRTCWNGSSFGHRKRKNARTRINVLRNELFTVEAPTHRVIVRYNRHVNRMENQEKEYKGKEGELEYPDRIFCYGVTSPSERIALE
ncbi:hypothetical protein EV363DRAFT_1297518 [Boletus edulis]|nr:hypothetical protein EV363DRAFT_1297518 [Boletus edulis]